MTTTSNPAQRPEVIPLSGEQVVGHADHWACFTQNIAQDVPNWLSKHIDKASLATGLDKTDTVTDESTLPFLLLTGNEAIHINQVLSLDENNKPKAFANAFPAVNSPYGQWAVIENVLSCQQCNDAILRLKADDGTIFYAFDQLYAINKDLYQKDTRYYVNLSALAYGVSPSKKNNTIKVEDPESIRYHLAFSDIINNNDGNVPPDLQQQIAKWQPDPKDLPLQPIEINVGNMCAYLFGETIGQQDEAWCQGQVLGKQSSDFNGVAMTLLDVVILRESLDSPVVIRMAVNDSKLANSQVGDYIQANIWLQVAIYAQNQGTESHAVNLTMPTATK